MPGSWRIGSGSFIHFYAYFQGSKVDPTGPKYQKLGHVGFPFLKS